jgi:hypothetical protein
MTLSRNGFAVCARAQKELIRESEAEVLPLWLGRADVGAAHTEVRKIFIQKRAGLTRMSALSGRIVCYCGIYRRNPLTPCLTKSGTPGSNEALPPKPEPSMSDANDSLGWSALG